MKKRLLCFIFIIIIITTNLLSPPPLQHISTLSKYSRDIMLAPLSSFSKPPAILPLLERENNTKAPAYHTSQPYGLTHKEQKIAQVLRNVYPTNNSLTLAFNRLHEYNKKIAEKKARVLTERDGRMIECTAIPWDAPLPAIELIETMPRVKMILKYYGLEDLNDLEKIQRIFTYACSLEKNIPPKALTMYENAEDYLLHGQWLMALVYYNTASFLGHPDAAHKASTAKQQWQHELKEKGFKSSEFITNATHEQARDYGRKTTPGHTTFVTILSACSTGFYHAYIQLNDYIWTLISFDVEGHIINIQGAAAPRFLFYDLDQLRIERQFDPCDGDTIVITGLSRQQAIEAIRVYYNQKTGDMTHSHTRFFGDTIYRLPISPAEAMIVNTISHHVIETTSLTHDIFLRLLIYHTIELYQRIICDESNSYFNMLLSSYLFPTEELRQKGDTLISLFDGFSIPHGPDPYYIGWPRYIRLLELIFEKSFPEICAQSKESLIKSLQSPDESSRLAALFLLPYTYAGDSSILSVLIHHLPQAVTPLEKIATLTALNRMKIRASFLQKRKLHKYSAPFLSADTVLFHTAHAVIKKFLSHKQYMNMMWTCWIKLRTTNPDSPQSNDILHHIISHIGPEDSTYMPKLLKILATTSSDKEVKYAIQGLTNIAKRGLYFDTIYTLCVKNMNSKNHLYYEWALIDLIPLKQCKAQPLTEKTLTTLLTEPLVLTFYNNLDKSMYLVKDSSRYSSTTTRADWKKTGKNPSVVEIDFNTQGDETAASWQKYDTADVKTFYHARSFEQVINKVFPHYDTCILYKGQEIKNFQEIPEASKPITQYTLTLTLKKPLISKDTVDLGA